jgi:hypothetical protein
MKLTKDEPGYYMDMLKELAIIDGVPNDKKLTFANLEQARKAKFKLPEMIFTIERKEIYCLGSTIRPGSLRVLLFSSFEIPFDSYTGTVSVVVNKSIKEYTAQPKSAGSYKYCEGGGWYSMANLDELNGKYYTDAY